MHARFLVPWLAASCLIAFTVPASAQWPLTGLPMCTVPEDMNAPIARPVFFCALTCDLGLSLFWQDGRSNFGSIYTTGVGGALPPPPPPVVEATLYLQRPGQQIPGAVVGVRPVSFLSQFPPPTRVFVWTDDPDTIPSLVRARRDFEGDPGVDWGDGLIVADGAGAQVDPSAIGDDSSGVIVTWLEVTADHRWVYAQRLDGFGHRKWGPAGVRIGDDTTTQASPRLQSDGAGGAYVLAEDIRGGAWALALHRIAPDGTIVSGWPASGVVLGTAPQESPGPLLRAGASGAWAVWSELATLSDNSTSPRPFVSFVGSSGEVSPVFTAAGTPIATGLDGDAVADDATVGTGDDLIVAYEYTQLVPDPAPNSTDLYAARFDVEGSHPAGWPASGLLVCGAPGVQRQGRILGNGGVFMAWTDERSGDGDIYAQEIRSDGTLPPEWPVNGLLVCGVAGTQQDPVIGPNALGGGFVIWRDGRDAITNGWDLYGQTVSSDARLTLDVEKPLGPTLSLGPPRPNPARDVIRLRLELPEPRTARFEVLDVAGRLVHREQLAAAAGPRELVWDLRTDAGARARPGLYLVRVRAGSFEKATRVVVTE